MEGVTPGGEGEGCLRSRALAESEVTTRLPVTILYVGQGGSPEEPRSPITLRLLTQNIPMATYSTKFSFTVPCSKDEFALLREIMEGDPFRDVLTFYAVHQETGDGQQVWFQSRQHGNPTEVATLLHMFLKQAGREDIITFSFAYDCSRPRENAYGGGAVVASAEGYEVIDDGSIRERLAQRAKRRQEGMYRVQAEIGVHADTPEEAAESAREAFRDPTTTATVFDVFAPERKRIDTRALESI